MQRNIKRSTRGPLRAINNALSTNTNVISCKPEKATDMVTSHKVVENESDQRNQSHLRMDNNQQPTTPVLRASCRLSQTKSSQSLYDILPMPLRSSSCRSEKQYLKSDIRRHFPIRTSGSKTSYQENKTPKCFDDTLDSLTNASVIMNSSLSSLDSASPIGDIPRKRHLGTWQILTESKQSRLSEGQQCVKLRNDSDTICLVMGSEVKTHPRYWMRKSAAEIPVTPEQTSPKITPKKHLAPICPVPMPSGFPLQLPIRYSSVSLPWECGNYSRPSLSRTVETQTSPIDSNKIPQTEKPKGRRHTGIGLRSSGTAQVLQNIRRKFGHLRRAISADRLNKNSSTSFENCNQDRISSSPNPYNTKQSTTNNANSEVHFNQDPSYKLTCHITRKNPDGSVQISLRRSSTNGQFGFFIARDSKGIYVSRLGSVRCAAKLWDVFHVGDRILEVQGIPCDTLEVEEVKNLIRGCELVEFRVKSSHHSDYKKNPFRLSLS
ncbi:unnamed protein product [Trichobilharzia szidati]|nr:unnamed protein product [Trichobilharzia szidati]